MKELYVKQRVAIVSARLHVMPFGEEHINARYISWLNDPGVTRYSERRHEKHTISSGRAYWHSFQGTPHRLWAIEVTQPLLGYIGTMTTYIDDVNRVADVGILIGEQSAWGQGFGLEAWQTLCTWLLNDVGIRKITAGTVVDNKAMLAIMEKSGMVPDGVRKAQVLLAGKPTDVIHAAIFKS